MLRRMRLLMEGLLLVLEVVGRRGRLLGVVMLVQRGWMLRLVLLLVLLVLLVLVLLVMRLWLRLRLRWRLLVRRMRRREV